VIENESSQLSPEVPQAAPGQASDPYPFWGYADVVVFFGLAFPCILLAVFLVQTVVISFHLHVRNVAFVEVPAQFLGYGLVFFVLYLLLSKHYDRPFWDSLRWVHTRPGAPRIVLYGFVLAFAISLLGRLIQTPDIDTPMKELLSSRSSLVLVAIFAITLGPICEELAFRGLLQPLLVRSFGRVAGIVLAALPFGVLHLAQYAGSWRHVALVTCAGIGFGWMRQASGSTRAAALMHAGYNFIFVAAMFSQWKTLPTAW